MPHNGGRSQIQSNFVAGSSGEFPYLDLTKTGNGWTLGDNSGIPAPNTLDVNGYPISISHGGVYQLVRAPTQAQRPGRYAVTWDSVGASTTVIVTNFGLTGATGSKTTSGSTGRYEFLPDAGVNGFNIGAATVGISNLRCFHVDDEALLNQGKLLGQKYSEVMRRLRFGVNRFLNKQNGNASNVVTWSTRKPVGYFTYAADEYRAALYATPASSPMTNVGTDYSITFGSGGPEDNRLLIVNFNASPTLKQATVTYTAGTPGTVNAVAHPFSNGEPVGISTSSSEPTLIFRGVNYYVVNAAADTFQIALTSGGAAIAIGSGAAGTQTVTGLCMINLNGTGRVPIRNKNGETITSANSISPTIFTTQTCYGSIVYDPDLKSWLLFGCGTASRNGIINAAPIEVMFQEALELEQHPYFVSPKLTLDPMTDWHAGLATYCRDNKPSWMVPRHECLNEPWNSAGEGVARYGWIKSFILWGPPSGGANNQFQFKNWIGKVASTMGQALNAVYGGDIDASRYWAIVGIQTVSFNTFSNGQLSDPVLTSASYITQSAPAQSGYVKDAAYSWLTHVCGANYFHPRIYGTATETSLAAAYAGGDLSAAVTYALNCNETPDADYNLARLRMFWPNLYAWAQGYTNRSGYKLRMTAYEGGYSSDVNVGESAQVKTLRLAAKFVPDMRIILTGGRLSDGTDINGCYGDFGDAGGEFPSCFQFGGTSNIWSIVDPDVFVSPESPQATAIYLYNNHRRRVSLTATA